MEYVEIQFESNDRKLSGVVAYEKYLLLLQVISRSGEFHLIQQLWMEQEKSGFNFKLRLMTVSLINVAHQKLSVGAGVWI